MLHENGVNVYYFKFLTFFLFSYKSIWLIFHLILVFKMVFRMKMEGSRTNMAIKSLLLQAWRERWSDLQWGINIKKVLPQGVSGDAYNLSDCVLQQALLGTSPNNLVLSYLQHALCSQVVSYAAVLQSISRYEDCQKPYCILSLLDFLASFQKRISCHGNAEECMFLCKSLLQATRWGLTCLLKAFVKLLDIKQSHEYSDILEKTCDVLLHFTTNKLYKSLLYVAKLEDQATFKQINQTCKDFEGKLSQAQSINAPKEKIEKIIEDLHNLDVVAILPQTPSPSHYSLFASLNGMTTLEAVLNPTSDIHPFIEQLLLIEKMQNLTRPVMYSELIRACFMGIIDSYGGSEELKWAAFTFLEVPQILLKLEGKDKENSVILEEGLELLLQYVPLLDLIDTKCNCDCLQLLLTELTKVGLLAENQVKKLLSVRSSPWSSKTPSPHLAAENQKTSLKNQEQPSTQPSASLILRAEPTVTSILKTLDADYSKNQDGLLGVLCHMMTGKSFELILAAAAATGKLQSFAVKLIKFNEFSKQINGEGTKASQTRAMLFDISFLMLCHIAQLYGAEIVISNGETKDSFFEMWATQCLPENGRYKTPDNSLPVDPNKVDLLLTQFTSGAADWKTSLVRWHEVCINAPSAIKEVLMAWEQGALSTDTVKSILDTVKGRMCCLPVCVSAWLCSFINTLHHDQRLKPMNMLQQFLTPLLPDSSNQYYNERSVLMCTIVRKMFHDLHPPSTVKISPAILTLPTRTPIGEILTNLFTDVCKRGWLELMAAHMFEHLLHVGGAYWFSDCLVREMLGLKNQSELYLTCDLLFAVFQINIEQCTLALLLYTLPELLLHQGKQDKLSYPQGTALARLAIMCILSAMTTVKTAQKEAKKKTGRKRSRREFEDILDNSDDHFRKFPKTMDLIEDSSISMLSLGSESGQNQSGTDASDPIHKATAGLFQIFASIVNDSVISQRSNFVFTFLKEAVTLGKDQAMSILKFMPPNMLCLLMKGMPDMFTIELVLNMCNTKSVLWRKVAAKALCQHKNYILAR